MAESDTILQLGIEAAREGNREEARNLFSLLTRQEPDNVQAWLWLAGVAEGPDERRAALERVIELDPGNDMAQKGLQAMGAGRAGSAASARDLSEEEMYAAELDSAFDDYDTVERAAPPPRNQSTSVHDEEAGVLAGDYGTARERVETRRNSRRSAFVNADDDDQPRRSGLSPLLLGLLALLVVVALLFFIIPPLLNRGGGDGGQAAQQTSDALGATDGTATAGNGGAVVTDPGVTGTGALTGTEPLTSTAGLTDTGALATSEPATSPAEPTPAPPPAGDPAAANPALVEIGAPVEASGWTFTFPSANYAAPLFGSIGGFNPSGRFVVVLVFVANNTGTPQPVPADFFVLKDAQGRVYDPLPQASSAYVQPGINADLSQESAIPANGLNTSVPLIFDVAPDATNLVLFARANPAQGWQVLNAVQ